MGSLLIEIQTEELPPKALKKLSDAFAKTLADDLRSQDFLETFSVVTPFGSPRRLAALISDVSERSPDKPFRQKLVPVKVGLDAEGKPTQALKKKLTSLHLEVDPSELLIVHDGKQDQLVYDGVKPGVRLSEALQTTLERTIKKLPIPKMMTYQLEDGTTVEFVRPVKHVVVLYDTEVLPIELFGLSSGRVTRGHRFHTHHDMEIDAAKMYSEQMILRGKVMPSFIAREHRMVDELKRKAESLNSDLIMPEDLVEEVAALTEWPVVYDATFDKEFLSVPEECLILTMQQNQKYFALRDKNGKLTNRFLVVSQIEAKDGGKAISEGNTRVVRARLADAKFFYDQDRLSTLESRVPGLEHVVYHNKLGSQLERSERVQKIASRIAKKIGADSVMSERAAKLAKADLRTLMVGEFPELQGIMGEYYAKHDREDDSVALAIREHYLPRFAGDALPSTRVSLSVALADKMETLAGLFGVGQLPTGDKDPFALRRHALGVLRMLVEKELPISLDELIEIATQEESVVPTVKDASSELKIFFMDRLRVMLHDQGFSILEIEAVIQTEPDLLLDVPRRLKAVRQFMALPEADSLAAANKRIENILKKAEDKSVSNVNPQLFIESEEQILWDKLQKVRVEVDEDYLSGRYEAVLKALAPLKEPVDRFFDKVMVNVDDERVRANRYALLRTLHTTMNQVAKLSCLAS